MPAPEEAGERIAAKNDLRKKVRQVKRSSPDDDPVKRAEAALSILSRHFDDWMADEVELLGHAAAAWAESRYRDAGRREALFRCVHDLKGQAATLGFPLAARVAGSLCAVLEIVGDDGNAPGPLVEGHVDAIRAIFREKAKDENDRVGLALAEMLGDLGRAFVIERGGDPTAS